MELQEIKMEVYRRGVELNPNSRPDDLMDVAGSFAEFFKHMDPVMQEQVDKHGMQIVPPVCRGLIRMGTHVLSQSDEVDAKGTDKALDLLDILVTASIVALGTIRTAEAAQKLMDDGEVVAEELLGKVSGYVEENTPEDKAAYSLFYSAIASGCVSLGFTGLNACIGDNEMFKAMLSSTASILHAAIKD